MIHLLRLVLLKLRKRPQQEPYMRIILEANKHPLFTSAKDSIATPLGHVPYKRSFVVKSQPWTPSVSARNAQWPDEREDEG